MKTQKHLYTKLMGLTLSFLLTPLVFSQTGPAGVGNSTNNQYWLDANRLSFTDGVPVSIWTDFSGNDEHFTQPFGERQPVYVESGISGLPSLSYDGVNDVLTSGSNPNMESSAVTYFIVYDRISTQPSMIINADYESSFKKWRTYSNNGQDRMISAHFSPSIKFVFFEDIGPASFFSSHLSPTGLKTYYQGTLEATNSSPYIVPTGHNDISLGNRSGAVTATYNYNGLISEVIIYNGELNDLERVLIENYLGTKYGMSIVTDRFDYEVTHQFGLIGIGNNGTDEQTIAQGAGVLELSSPTEMTAHEYLLVAHTEEGLLDYEEVDIPAALVDHKRLSRTWRASETSEVGDLTVTFRLGGFDYATPDTYRLLIDNDGVFADATILTGTYDGPTNSVSFTTNLSDGDYFTLTGIQEILEIHSVVDGPWSEPTTWDCECIPTVNDLVHIDPATTVTVDINAITNYFKIESTGTLIMDTDVTLDVNGDWDIDGAVNCTDGTISLTSDSPQTITTATGVNVILNNLLIENTSGSDITFFGPASNFRLNGTLSPNIGDIVIDPSTSFIITSTSASEGGRVGPILNTASLSGNFTVERNIPAGPANWRDLSSPTIGSTFLDWDPDLSMSGPGFPDGCAYDTEGCFESVTFYKDGTFGSVSDATTPIENGKGFEMFIGTDLLTFSGATVKSTGELNTRDDISHFYDDGWSTIGNPYASPIAFNELSRTSHIANYYYVLNGVTGSYEWYDGATSTSSVATITEDGIIPTGQGVWIFCTSTAGGTITYSQLSKTETPGHFLTAATVDESLKLTLTENNSSYNCTMVLEEAEGATDKMDISNDIVHLSTGQELAPSLAVNTNDGKIRKNFIKPDGRDKSFNLFTSFKKNGIYTLSLSNWENFRTYNKIIILDEETGETVNLKNEDYLFYANATEEGEEPTARFTLLLSNANEDNGTTYVTSNNEELEGNIVIKQIGDQIDIQTEEVANELSTVSLTNVLGQEEVFNMTLKLNEGSNVISLPKRLKGFYILSVRTGETFTTKKIML